MKVLILLSLISISIATGSFKSHNFDGNNNPIDKLALNTFLEKL